MALKVEFQGVKPTQAHAGDAGLDLYSEDEVIVPAGGRRAISTGTKLAIPEGHVGLLVGRSGLGANRGLRLANSVGIIDSGYRGNIVVVMANDSEDNHLIEHGERIAQIVIVPFALAQLVRVQAFDVTERGEGGFGSSGRA